MAKQTRPVAPMVKPRAQTSEIGTSTSLDYVQSYPVLDANLTFKELGRTGLRQYNGWIREEFLPQLRGRQAAKVYREMLDNSAAIGGAMAAIIGAMRKVNWRTDPADDTPKAQELADFAESLRFDMSHTWEDFIAEALSMLAYGFAPFEIVYKKRNGMDPGDGEDGEEAPKSKYKDGRIGIRKLPIRGQDTVLKWFLGPNGEIKGLTQQPYTGGLIDIPIEKLLIFRPSAHKNNPEGRSVLRNCYINYFFVKRLQEQEAVMYERFSGLPVLKVPNELMDKAAKNDPVAMATLETYKKIVTNVRVDEQMGVLLPSDHFPTSTGGAGAPMFEFKLETPGTGRSVSADSAIQRHKMDIAVSMLADFIIMGHDARGAQNLGETKLDMFMQAVEGWLNSVAAVLNRHLLPRIWKLNNLDPDLMPEYVPDTAQRLDLDVLSAFMLRLAQAGMPLFPDPELESYLRDTAGLPDIHDPAAQGQLAGVSDGTDALGRTPDERREVQESTAGIETPQDKEEAAQQADQKFQQAQQLAAAKPQPLPAKQPQGQYVPPGGPKTPAAAAAKIDKLIRMSLAKRGQKSGRKR